MAAETGATTSRVLNSIAYSMANQATDLSTGLVNSDYVLVYDTSAEAMKVVSPTNVAVGAAASRIVTTTATALSLTATQHAERIVVVNTNDGTGPTITLPAATGSGMKYEIVNGIAQTQGSIVVTRSTSDVMKGYALNFDSTAVATAANIFVTLTATAMTWNRTTTGGKGHDTMELWDEAAAVWRVRVFSQTSGAKATPFS